MMFTKFLKPGLDLTDLSEKEKRLCFNETPGSEAAEALPVQAAAEEPKLDYNDGKAVQDALAKKAGDAKTQFEARLKDLAKQLPQEEEAAAMKTAEQIARDQAVAADRLIQGAMITLKDSVTAKQEVFETTVATLEGMFGEEALQEAKMPKVKQYVEGTAYEKETFVSKEQVSGEVNRYANKAKDLCIAGLLQQAMIRYGQEAGEPKLAAIRLKVSEIVLKRTEQAAQVQRRLARVGLNTEDISFQEIAEKALKGISQAYGVEMVEGDPKITITEVDFADLDKTFGPPKTAESPVLAQAAAPAEVPVAAPAEAPEQTGPSHQVAVKVEVPAEAKAKENTATQSEEFLAKVSERTSLNKWLENKDNRKFVRSKVTTAEKEDNTTEYKISFKTLGDVVNATSAQREAIQNNLSIGNLFTDDEIQKIIAVEDGRGGGVEKNAGKKFLTSNESNAKRGLYDAQNNKYVAIYEGAQVTMINEPAKNQQDYFLVYKIEDADKADFLAELNGRRADADTDNAGQVDRVDGRLADVPRERAGAKDEVATEQSSLDKLLEYASRLRVAIINDTGRVASNYVYLYRDALVKAYEEYLKGDDGIIPAESRPKLDYAKANTENLDTITSALIKATTRQDKVEILRPLEYNFEENFMVDCRNAVDGKGDAVAAKEVQEADIIQNGRESLVKSVAGGVMTGAGIVAKKTASTLLSKLPFFGNATQAKNKQEKSKPKTS